MFNVSLGITKEQMEKKAQCVELGTWQHVDWTHRLKMASSNGYLKLITSDNRLSIDSNH